MSKKQNDFIAQGSILAMASILVRMIGMVYRIPMTAIIGDKGNGLYSYAYSMYTILLLLSSYSLPLAVSKMVSVRVQRGQWKNVQRIFVCAIVFALCIGTVFSLIVLFGARVLTNVFFNSDLAAISLRFMAPTILIMALLGVFRGFFQGLQNTIPTAASQVLEGIIHAVFAVLFAYILFGYGEKLEITYQVEDLSYAWGAAGGAIGTGIAALAALVFCFLLYLAYRPVLQSRVRKDESNAEQSYGDIFRLLISIALPVIASTALYNLIELVDGSLFSNIMTAKGLEETKDSIWGAYNAKALLMVHIPVAIASAMAVSLVPALTAAYSTGRRSEARGKINATLRFISLIAFPSAVGLFVLAGPIIKTLFPGDRSDATFYLMAVSPAVIAFSFSTITNSILQGIDRMDLPVKHSLAAMLVHILILLLLTLGFNLGIYGVVISYVIYGAVISGLNFLSIRKSVAYRPDYINIFLKPAIASGLMGVVCFVVYQLFHLFLGTAIPMLIAVAAAVLVYFAAGIKIDLLNRETLKDFPKGHVLIRLAEKMKLM